MARRTPLKNNPRRYQEYVPIPGRTLESKRTWTERVLDLRHAACLSVIEFSQLTGWDRHTITTIERRGNKKHYRPAFTTIMMVRRMERIFEEELVTYLMKPHSWLRYREMRRYNLMRYGGYRVTAGRKFKQHTIVTFTGRTLEDIAQMGDVEAIRALKNVTLPAFAVHRPPPPYEIKYRNRYNDDGLTRILSAASRGYFMSLAEIAHTMGHDQEIWIGQPVDAGQ